MLSLLALQQRLYFGVALYYVLVTWQLGNLYPPFSYALLLAGLGWLAIAIDFKNIKTEQVIVALLAGGLSIVTVYGYFYDYIQLMKDTVYPGSRNEVGGSYLSAPMLFSLLVPTAWIDENFDILIYKSKLNVCEISILSTISPSLYIFFINYSQRVKLYSVLCFFKKYNILFIISLFMLIWICLPIPADVGKYLYLNKVVPKRLMLGFGLLVSILCASCINNTSFKIAYLKIVAYWLIYLFICLLIKRSFIAIKIDAIAAVSCLIIMLFLWKISKEASITLIAGCCVFSLLTFGLFNPLQDTRPIFEIHETDYTRDLTQQQNVRGYVFSHLPGVVVNGLGFRAIAHVNTTPQLDFWRAKFPDIPKEQFNNIFNRYAHIYVVPGNKIIIPQDDVIEVPQDCFLKGLHDPCLGISIAP